MQLILLECRADATDITLKAQKKKKKQQLSISEPIRISRRIQIRKQQICGRKTNTGTDISFADVHGKGLIPMVHFMNK